jgi:hypothetical protein
MVLGLRGQDALVTSHGKEMLFELEKVRKSVPLSILTIFVFLLLNLTAFFLTSHYAILWILSSLLFCVFSMLFVMMPTTRRTREQEPEEMKVHINKSNIMEHKKVLGLAFWNSFFINSEPMAFGIIALFSFDIPLVLYLAIVSQILTWDVAGLLLVQSAGMILFYVGIVRMKPYEGKFLEEVWSVERSVAGVLKGRSVKRFRTIFFTSLFISIFVASLVAAMLMPGSSVKLLRGDANIDLAKEVAPLLLIFLSQFLLVRETQGVASRRMADALLRKKLSLGETHDEGKGERFNELDGHMPAYFKVVRHDILGYMPVYMMVPDLSIIFLKEKQSK